MDDRRPLWFNLALVLLLPIAGMALGVALTVLLGIGQKPYSGLVINLFFLATCIGLLRNLKFSRQDVGLKFLQQHKRWHVIGSAAALCLYMLFYIGVIRISSLRPLSSGTTWGLLTYLIVVLAEELYFRGMLYSVLEKRFSARIALIVSSFLFGLFHAHQGLGVMVSRAFSGWLWGSVRYSSGMIFLLIFPVHFVYNAVWLLFEGNWGNPPTWAIIALPVIEYALGLSLVIAHDRKSNDQDSEGVAVKAPQIQEPRPDF